MTAIISSISFILINNQINKSSSSSLTRPNSAITSYSFTPYVTS